MIRQIISDSDYYILIIGGRYVSSEADGISYTQREYELAVELRKPVLVLLHEAPDKLPLGKNETEKKLRRKLEQFRTIIKKHHCKYWRDIGTLQSHVIVGLTATIQTHSAIGWVRADGYNDTELLRRLADLPHRYDKIHAEAESLRARLGASTDTSAYAQGNEQTSVFFHFGARHPRPQNKTSDQVRLSWAEIFFGLGMAMMVSARHQDLADALSPTILKLFDGSGEFWLKTRDKDPERISRSCLPTTESLDAIVRQLVALGLIEPHLVSRTFSDDNGRISSTLEDSWRLTTEGRTKYLLVTATPTGRVSSFPPEP